MFGMGGDHGKMHEMMGDKKEKVRLEKRLLSGICMAES